MTQVRAENYANYLQIPQLLELQQTITSAHDELQFIVVHQSFELWFKLALFELEG
ncbi:MAG: tryptophan 2,3-dioxygenase family protein, partial [Myxococcota bacterium]